MSQTSIERFLLLLIALAYVLVGMLFAIRTPDWQAPDEPAHYNYVAQVAENGCCPVIETGDWQQTYQNELTASRFAPDTLDRLNTVQYEDHQPPVYYLLASLVYKLTSGSLIALRLLSVLIGLGVVLCAYACAKVVYPDYPGVALGAAAFVAFLPQHMAMLTAVNNDGLSELWIGLTLWATLRYLRGQSIQPWQLGLLIGLIFVTKSTGYLMAGVVVLALFVRWWSAAATSPLLAWGNSSPLPTGTLRSQTGEGKVSEANRGEVSKAQHSNTGVNSERHFGSLIRSMLLFLIPALIIGGLWWGRNFTVYGFPDFLGLGAHNRVVADQPRTADFIAESGSQTYFSRALSDTFNSFWGQFGWMALPLQGWMYTAFQALFGVVIIGLLIHAFVLRPTLDAEEKRFQQHSWLVMGAMLLLAALAYVYYNTEFLQFQGRYLFPALIPFGLLMALGVDAWRRWLLARLSWAQWLPVGLYLALALFDLYLIWRVIPPGLAP